MCALAALALLCTPAAAKNSCPGAYTQPSKAKPGKLRRTVVCLVNARRTAADVPAMKLDPLLSRAATRHSRDMVRRRYYAHDGPDGSTLSTRVRATGYLDSATRSWLLGENIAQGRGRKGTPARIVRAWMRSPGHRANMLSATFSDIGVGTAVGLTSGDSRGLTYTLDFGAVH